MKIEKTAKAAAKAKPRVRDFEPGDVVMVGEAVILRIHAIDQDRCSDIVGVQLGSGDHWYDVEDDFDAVLVDAKVVLS